METVSGAELEGPLPSYSTNNMCKEMKVFAPQQIAEALTGQTNLAVKYDGTTKTVGHLVEIEIATEKQTLLVGLSQQGGGTAVEYVDTIMHDTGAIETSSFVDIKSHIVNTMTDRCKTNDAVDHIMGQKLGKELTSFRCSMHHVDGMAKECERVTKSFEVTNNIKDLKKSDKYPFTI